MEELLVHRMRRGCLWRGFDVHLPWLWWRVWFVERRHESVRAANPHRKFSARTPWVVYRSVMYGIEFQVAFSIHDHDIRG